MHLAVAEGAGQKTLYKEPQVEQFFWQQAVSMATRDFSRNPSHALREAQSHPVMVTKYGQPVACLVPIDYWNALVDTLRDRDMSERIERRVT